MRTKETIKQKHVRELHTRLRLHADTEGNTALNGKAIAKLFQMSTPTVSIYLHELAKQHKIYRKSPHDSVRIIVKKPTICNTPKKDAIAVRTQLFEGEPLINELDKVAEQDMLKNIILADLREWEKSEEEYLEAFMRTMIDRETRKQSRWKIGVLFLWVFIGLAFLVALLSK